MKQTMCGAAAVRPVGSVSETVDAEQVGGAPFAAATVGSIR